MTDGIIQQVCDGWDNEIAEAIKIELIEKIKQNAHTEELSDYPHLTLKELIGDNKDGM